ncbi:MAG: indolepyruvate ferredoxin oxidoreductase family protein [Actinomycetota bacterium]
MTAVEFDLQDRLGATEGTVAMTGVHALMRVTADQQRADRARGLRTAGLVAGYRGSPLGGVDDAYAQYEALLRHHDVQFISGVNEDLGATMIWGSQLAHLQADRRFDGVFGLWYGKGPGIDRSLDALRHANLAGVDPNGGVLAAVGDDPACKSSTIPSASEGVLADLAMPTLYPGSVQEVLDLGRWGYELSRACGSWVGFKIHTDIADQYASVNVDAGRLAPPVSPPPTGWTPRQEVNLMAPASVAVEADTYGPRVEAARRFVAANRLDHTTGHGPARLGIVAAGKTFADLAGVLNELGLRDETALAAAGIRLWKPAMIWPLERHGLAAFAEGLDEILVIEEKRSFVESQVRDLLYDADHRPRVTGKHAPDASPLVPMDAALTPDLLVPAVLGRIEAVVPEARVRRPRERIAVTALDPSSGPSRTPYFCSGCPHNRSTVVPEGSVAGGGIGCHTMAVWMDRGMDGFTHMGGEGAQWAGMQPFVGTPHRFQNIGDGTFFHSGTLALRQAVSAGTNITYKILYNGTVAMTGGQDAAGNMPVPQLTRLLEAEGVVETVVVTEHRYDDPLAETASVSTREEYDAVQRRLRDVAGVTAIVYDQRCAAELRRDRKRGEAERPTRRIYINEAVCDGCGDCGRISNCMSVHPVDTVFGRKTRIHQESCNFDYSCVEGNCPAFITVEIDPEFRAGRVGSITVPAGDDPSEPDLPASATVLVVGIGGTGVVTVSQVLSTAALLDGKRARSLDQTGLAQKGGRVISNLRISDDPLESAPRVGDGEADAMLIFDVIGGTTPEILSKARPGRTATVVSTVLLPTGHMVSDVGQAFPELDAYRAAIDGATGEEGNVWLDAEGIAREVFGSQPAANLVVLGIAYQRGLLPVSGAAIEAAINQNGVAVGTNTEAFRLGRRLAVEPGLLDHLARATEVTAPRAPEPTEAVGALIARVRGSDALVEMLRWRIPELIEYQDLAYAERYVRVLERVRAAEQRVGDTCVVSEVVAFQLYKLMAYKDEYEVARLHLRDGLSDEIAQRFGPDAAYAYQLAPPSAKRFRGSRKTAVPAAAGRAAFRALRRGRRLRGTRLDPFGRTEERRLERRLIEDYPALVDRVLALLDEGNVEDGAALLHLADRIRGFDAVKLANIAAYDVEVAEALAAYEADSG